MPDEVIIGVLLQEMKIVAFDMLGPVDPIAVAEVRLLNQVVILSEDFAALEANEGISPWSNDPATGPELHVGFLDFWPLTKQSKFVSVPYFFDTASILASLSALEIRL